MSKNRCERCGRKISVDDKICDQCYVIRYYQQVEADLSAELSRLRDHQGMVESTHYVWCHVHGEIHGKNENYYGDDPCSDWATVYVKADDPEGEY
jgi:hypothetical protein